MAEYFWDTSDIVSEFDADQITPVMKPPIVISEEIKATAQDFVEAIEKNIQPCYICTITTNLQLISGKHPICIGCVKGHILK